MTSYRDGDGLLRGRREQAEVGVTTGEPAPAPHDRRGPRRGRATPDPLTPAGGPDAARARGAVLVDIRPAAQREAEGELPGALVIERNVLEWRFDPAQRRAAAASPATTSQVIVLCQEGYTSSLAAAALQDLGIHRATDVIGGMPPGGRGRPPRRRPRARAVDDAAVGSVAGAGDDLRLAPTRAHRPWRRASLQASSMSRARVSTCSRLIVSLTRARMIVTSWAFGRQRVGRHHPAALGRQLPGDVELVVPVVAGEPEGDQRKLLLVAADELEPAHRLELLGEHPGVRPACSA